MTCIGRKNLSTPSIDRFAVHPGKPSFESPFSPNLDLDTTPSFPYPASQRARRPALIPPNSSLTLAETEELVGNRINRPLFPPPDPKIIKQLRPQSPESSGTTFAPPPPFSQSATGSPIPPEWAFIKEECNQAAARSLFPTSSASDTRRRSLWLKARAHYVRDRKIRLEAMKGDTQSAEQVPPKRKRSAFLLDEEMRCHREDVVGTPHLSEMVPGDDVTEIGVGDLSMGDPAMMDIPEEEMFKMGSGNGSAERFGGVRRV